MSRHRADQGAVNKGVLDTREVMGSVLPGCGVFAFRLSGCDLRDPDVYTIFSVFCAFMFKPIMHRHKVLEKGLVAIRTANKSYYMLFTRVDLHEMWPLFTNRIFQTNKKK